MKIKQVFDSQREAIDYLAERGWYVDRSMVAGIWMRHPTLRHLNLVRNSGSRWVIEAL